MNIEQVAKRLGVSQRTIRRYIKSGKLKGNRLGRVWRIEAHDVDRCAQPGLSMPVIIIDDRAYILNKAHDLITEFTNAMDEWSRYPRVFKADNTLIYDVLAIFATHLIKWVMPDNAPQMISFFGILEHLITRIKRDL